MKLSTCCDATIQGNEVDPICSQCKEHCDTYDDEFGDVDIVKLDIDKMGEEMRERDRNEIPIKPKGYRGAGEHKFEGD